MEKFDKKRKKIEEMVDLLGTGNNDERRKIIRDVDIFKEYFFGRYHKASLFDIAAHRG